MGRIQRSSVMLAMVALAACGDLPMESTSPLAEVGAAALYSVGSEAALVVWGPVTFVREPGKPGPLVETIHVTDPAVFRDAVLVIRNGRPDGSRRAGAAVVRLNGIVVAGPSSFSAHVLEVRVPIDLTSGAAVEAELRGAPHGEITVWVEAVPLTENEIAVAILERFIFSHLPHPQFAGGGQVGGTHMWFWIEGVHRVKVTSWGVNSSGSGGAGFIADIDALVEYSVWDGDIPIPQYRRMPLRITGLWAIYGPTPGINLDTLPLLQYLELVLGVNSAAHTLGVQLNLVDGIPVQVNTPIWPE
jgi:hypothetical protein